MDSPIQFGRSPPTSLTSYSIDRRHCLLLVGYIPQCIPALEEGRSTPCVETPPPSSPPPLPLLSSSPQFCPISPSSSVAMAHGVCQCKCTNVSTASSSGASRKSDHPNTDASRRRGGYIAPPPHPQSRYLIYRTCTTSHRNGSRFRVMPCICAIMHVRYAPSGLG